MLSVFLLELRLRSLALRQGIYFIDSPVVSLWASPPNTHTHIHAHAHTCTHTIGLTSLEIPDKYNQQSIQDLTAPTFQKEFLTLTLY